jgi:hypothetical protein
MDCTLLLFFFLSLSRANLHKREEGAARRGETTACVLSALCVWKRRCYWLKRQRERESERSRENRKKERERVVTSVASPSHPVIGLLQY